MPDVTFEDLQLAIAELKRRLARSVRNPLGHAPGHYSGLAQDIKALEEMTRDLGSGSPGPQRGRRSV